MCRAVVDNPHAHIHVIEHGQGSLHVIGPPSEIDILPERYQMVPRCLMGWYEHDAVKPQACAHRTNSNPPFGWVRSWSVELIADNTYGLSQPRWVMERCDRRLEGLSVSTWANTRLNIWFVDQCVYMEDPIRLRYNPIGSRVSFPSPT